MLARDHTSSSSARRKHVHRVKADGAEQRELWMLAIAGCSNLVAPPPDLPVVRSASAVSEVSEPLLRLVSHQCLCSISLHILCSAFDSLVFIHVYGSMRADLALRRSGVIFRAVACMKAG